MKKFFVGCNIRFENELEKELKEFWPYLIEPDGRPHGTPLRILQVEPGGLELEAPLHLGLQINFFSKLANRVLLRIGEFKAKDFPKAFQALSKLAKDPLLQGFTFRYQVSASESRLNNEKRFLEILQKIFGPEDKTSTQTLFFRAHQDHCQLSLDSTGLHLHKRSERTEQGAAPVRETLAAFCARRLIGETSLSELRKVKLIDPLCGSGTLLLESQRLHQPSLRDDFAFLHWKGIAKILKSPSLKANYPSFPELFKDLSGFDSDEAAIQRARDLMAKSGLASNLEVEDLFQAQAKQEPGCWVISNPPYGERLKANFKPMQLIQQIDKIYLPEKMGLLLSARQAQEIRQPTDSSLKLRDQWDFQNGGLAVRFLVFSRKLGEFDL